MGEDPRHVGVSRVVSHRDFLNQAGTMNSDHDLSDEQQ